MRKSVRTLFENLKILPGFVLAKVGLDRFLKNFRKCTDKNLEKRPKKVGFCPFLKDKSGQKNLVAFSQNGTFLAFFARFWAICDNLLEENGHFAHLPTFILN